MKKLILFLLLFAPTICAAQDLDSLYARNLLPVGSVAPEISMQTIDGKPFLLSEHKGEWIVLDFWASWCGDCRRDIPTMKDVYTQNRFAVTFVGVSFDHNRDAWEQCVKTNDMQWTHISELKKWKETQVNQDYRIQWVPTYYLIDPDGRIAFRTVMIDKLAQQLKNYRNARKLAVASKKFPIYKKQKRETRPMFLALYI